MTLASIDSCLLSRNCEINCLRLGRPGQSVRPTFGANLKRKLNHRNVKVYVIYHFNNNSYISERAPYLITKLAFLLCQYNINSVTDLFNAIFFHPQPETQKCQLKQNNCFIPRINLLTLRCFVAEVRWLFPVNR